MAVVSSAEKIDRLMYVRLIGVRLMVLWLATD